MSYTRIFVYRPGWGLEIKTPGNLPQQATGKIDPAVVEGPDIRKGMIDASARPERTAFDDDCAIHAAYAESLKENLAGAPASISDDAFERVFGIKVAGTPDSARLLQPPTREDVALGRPNFGTVPYSQEPRGAARIFSSMVPGGVAFASRFITQNRNEDWKTFSARVNKVSSGLAMQYPGCRITINLWNDETGNGPMVQHLGPSYVPPIQNVKPSSDKFGRERRQRFLNVIMDLASNPTVVKKLAEAGYELNPNFKTLPVRQILVPPSDRKADIRHEPVKVSKYPADRSRAFQDVVVDSRVYACGCSATGRDVPQYCPEHNAPDTPIKSAVTENGYVTVPDPTGDSTEPSKYPACSPVDEFDKLTKSLNWPDRFRGRIQEDKDLGKCGGAEWKRVTFQDGFRRTAMNPVLGAPYGLGNQLKGYSKGYPGGLWAYAQAMKDFHRNVDPLCVVSVSGEFDLPSADMRTEDQETLERSFARLSAFTLEPDQPTDRDLVGKPNFTEQDKPGDVVLEPKKYFRGTIIPYGWSGLPNYIALLVRKAYRAVTKPWQDEIDAALKTAKQFEEMWERSEKRCWAMDKMIRDLLLKMVDLDTKHEQDLSIKDAAIRILQMESLNEGKRAGQRYFLLEQAPMLDMVWDISRLMALRTPFAYVNPTTFEKLRSPGATITPINNMTQAYRLGGAPTYWVVTDLMPPNRMILSSNLMPGLSL